MPQYPVEPAPEIPGTGAHVGKVSLGLHSRVHLNCLRRRSELVAGEGFGVLLQRLKLCGAGRFTISCIGSMTHSCLTQAAGH